MPGFVAPKAPPSPHRGRPDDDLVLEQAFLVHRHDVDADDGKVFGGKAAGLSCCSACAAAVISESIGLYRLESRELLQAIQLPPKVLRYSRGVTSRVLTKA